MKTIIQWITTLYFQKYECEIYFVYIDKLLSFKIYLYSDGKIYYDSLYPFEHETVKFVLEEFEKRRWKHGN